MRPARASGGVRIQLSRHVRGVTPDRAHAWWSDFREGRTDHGWIPGERRRILSRNGNEVQMEDSIRGMFRERTTATVEANAVRFRGENSLASFAGAYSFAPDGDGTSIALDVELELRRGLGWTSWIARPIAKLVIGMDLAGHARDIEKER